MIAERDIQALRERTPDVLMHYGVKNPHSTFFAPWKDGKSNTIYSPESQLITNWSDDERINVFGLVEKMEGIKEFKAQVQFVADIVGYGPLSEERGAPPHKWSKAQASPFDVPKQVGYDDPMLPYALLMQKCLDSEIAMTYLHSRGFCALTAFENIIGFMPDRKGLVNDDGTLLFTKYEPNTPRGYLVIPFPSDESFGRVQYAMLRPIPGDQKPENKELRPTGYKSPLFREYLLRQSLDVLYIAEGLLDCFALESMVDKPVMALGGDSFHKRLTDVLYYTLPSYRPKKIILALDNDEPGQQATEKIKEKLNLLEIPFNVLQYPDGCKDANDLLLMKRGDLNDRH